MIHIYYGNGKGKTTAALGLALRACGAGKSVAFYSFLKDDSSCERLARCDIHFYKNPESLPFLYKMRADEKKRYAAWARKAADDAFSCGADVVVLDEFLDVTELLGEAYIRSISFDKDTEYVITGHCKNEFLFGTADYITQMVSERHPYGSGIPARRGIEY